MGAVIPVCVYKHLGGAGGSISLRRTSEDSFAGRDHTRAFKTRAGLCQAEKSRQEITGCGGHAWYAGDTSRPGAGSELPGDGQ